MIRDISNIRDGRNDASGGHVVAGQNTSEISTVRSLVKAEKSAIERGGSKRQEQMQKASKLGV